MLIDGEWVHGDAQTYLDVKNPSTGEVIAQISNANKEHVEEAVRAAE